MFPPSENYHFFQHKASKIAIESSLPQIINLIQKAVAEQSDFEFLKLAEAIFENLFLPETNLYHLFNCPEFSTSAQLETTIPNFAMRYVEQMSIEPTSEFFIKFEIFLLKLRVVSLVSLTAKLVFNECKMIISHFFYFDFQKIVEEIPELMALDMDSEGNLFQPNFQLEVPLGCIKPIESTVVQKTTDNELDLSINQNYLVYKNTLDLFLNTSNPRKQESLPPILKLLKHPSENQCLLNRPESAYPRKSLASI